MHFSNRVARICWKGEGTPGAGETGFRGGGGGVPCVGVVWTWSGRMFWGGGGGIYSKHVYMNHECKYRYIRYIMK